MSLRPHGRMRDILCSLGVRSSAVTPSADRSRGGADESRNPARESRAKEDQRYVQVFFGGEAQCIQRCPSRRARELTSRFAKHYHHAVPFGEDVLDDIWNRCHDLRCGTARQPGRGNAGRRILGLPRSGAATAQTGYPTPLAGGEPRDVGSLSRAGISPQEPDLSPEPDLHRRIRGRCRKVRLGVRHPMEGKTSCVLAMSVVEIATRDIPLG